MTTARMLYQTNEPGTWLVVDGDTELGTVTMTGLGYVSWCVYCDRLPIVKSTAVLAGRYLVEHSH